MKEKLFIIILLLSVNFTFGQQFTKLEGDYLGQPAPEDTPLVFAQGIISVDSTIEHGNPIFSADGNRIHWQSNLRHKDRKTEIFLKTMKRIEGKWTIPEASPYGMPAYSPDGNKLFFVQTDTALEKGVYFVEKQDGNWTEPECLNFISRFPELKYMICPSVTNDGTLYFLSNADNLGSMNNIGIYRSELNNGVYSKPELLPKSINTKNGTLNWMPFISPDESYLLFSSNRLNKQQDIFISFRQPDGTWSEAIGLGEEINTQAGERFPYVSPDGKYLFFTRWISNENEDIMWVSTNIIKKLREERNE